MSHIIIYTNNGTALKNKQKSNQQNYSHNFLIALLKNISKIWKQVDKALARSFKINGSMQKISLENNFLFSVFLLLYSVIYKVI